MWIKKSVYTKMKKELKRLTFNNGILKKRYSDIVIENLKLKDENRSLKSIVFQYKNAFERIRQILINK